MSTRRLLLLALAALVSISLAQTAAQPAPAAAAGTLTVAGNVGTPLTVASASDGYQVLFSLPELDPAFTSNDIIIADTIDGKPLFAYQGPFRIVSPKDSRASRSIRMLQRLEVVRLRK